MTTPEDLGPPSSYMALAPGAHVITADGERIGSVDEVVGDASVDIFDGIVIKHGMTGPHLFATAEQVAEIRERGVVLTIAANQVDSLPAPGKQRQEED